MQAHYDPSQFPVLHLRLLQYYVLAIHIDGVDIGWRSLSFSGRQVPGRLFHVFPRSVNACKTSALSHLQVNAPNYFIGGLADSYHREYNSTQRRFLQFCQEFSLVPLPASEKNIILFSTHLAQRIKQQSINVDLSSDTKYLSLRLKKS